MRVLLTNDDGVGAAGHVVLAQALLDEGHEVQVIGPLGERSGSGTSVGTIEHGANIAVQEIPLGTSPGLTGIALDAPPALAVLTALGEVFGPRPDIVVSGINPGHNVGRSVIFSGTVGAALAATTLGIPSFAVSCGFPPGHRFDTAAAAAVRALRWFERAGLPRICANVNVPDMDLDDVQGVRSTHFSSGGMFSLEMRREGDRLVLTRGEPSDRNTEGSDLEAVRQGFIAVSILKPMDVDSGPEADSLGSRLAAAVAGASPLTDSMEDVLR
jgi:5'-nucleotidase